MPIAERAADLITGRPAGRLVLPRTTSHGSTTDTDGHRAAVHVGDAPVAELDQVLDGERDPDVAGRLYSGRTPRGP